MYSNHLFGTSYILFQPKHRVFTTLGLFFEALKTGFFVKKINENFQPWMHVSAYWTSSAWWSILFQYSKSMRPDKTHCKNEAGQIPSILECENALIWKMNLLPLALSKLAQQLPGYGYVSILFVIKILLKSLGNNMLKIYWNQQGKNSLASHKTWIKFGSS